MLHDNGIRENLCLFSLEIGTLYLLPEGNPLIILLKNMAWVTKDFKTLFFYYIYILREKVGTQYQLFFQLF